MYRSEKGFTLIELVAVIVILGVLAATAVPKFVDLSDAANDAAIKGIASALSSASSLNHANNIAVDANLTSNVVPFLVNTCDDVAALLEGGLDEGYVLQPDEGSTVASGGIATEGGVSTCEVRYDADKDNVFDSTDIPVAQFTAYGVK